MTLADFKRYIPFPFDVPAGTDKLHIDFRFDPLRVSGIKNKVTISLYEPDGTFRGCSFAGIDHREIHVSAGRADDGFFPGRLSPGRWTAELETFMVLPGTPIRYELGIWLSAGSGPERQSQLRFPRAVSRAQPGWYRGDLHVHTYHSDGHRSVGELLDTLRESGLDFVALTEHNNVTQLYDHDLDGAGDLAIIPGMELTTYYGHALSLGTTEWIDWRIGRNGRRMEHAAAEIHAQGGLLIAAHMANVGDPFCTGCAWLFDQFMPGTLDAVEVWNGRWARPRSNNEGNLQLWYGWLNAGHRLPATAGTDAHSSDTYDVGPGFNLIWADELSAEGLMEGLRRGHVMLSSGPRLWLEAPAVDGKTAMMGDAITARGPCACVNVRWSEAPADSTVRLIGDGYVQAEWSASPEGERSAELMVLRWITAELRDSEGSLLALTNPIYLDSDLHL